MELLIKIEVDFIFLLLTGGGIVPEMAPNTAFRQSTLYYWKSVQRETKFFKVEEILLHRSQVLNDKGNFANFSGMMRFENI